MKKITVLLLTIIFLIIFSSSVFAGDIKTEPSIVMAINNETIFVNEVCREITCPILVFDKTYVDLYALAPFLNIDVEWVDAQIGFFRATAGKNVCDFTIIFHWEDLINQKYKFFVKDSKVFVSLRELNELTGYDITYTDGLIIIGRQTDINNKIYGDIHTYDYSDYVYTTYPFGAEYVVYPYQKYSYESMMADTKKLQHMYPELIKTSSIGKSVEGRDLLLIEFGRGTDKVFVCGTHHAREYIATTYLMYAIDRYAYAYRTGSMWGQYNPKAILDNITFCIVPMINPDGVNLVQNGVYATKNPNAITGMGIYEGKKYGYSSWKANVNGVDLNWNYNKDWSPEKNKNPRGSSGFNGDYPYTEPETIAVSDYVDNNIFDAYLSFHTQGEIFYWADNKEEPLNVQEAIRIDTGFKGYEDSGTGVGGSFFDYVYRKFNKPTITVELCPYIGNFPYPDKQFDTVWNPTKNILLVVGNEIIYNKLSK